MDLGKQIKIHSSVMRDVIKINGCTVKIIDFKDFPLFDSSEWGRILTRIHGEAVLPV